MAITRSQIARQLLAEGGVSLDDAKRMAPEGEFLAYINPKEAQMLKQAGGSGIMTPMGIPSFVEYGTDDPGTMSQASASQSQVDSFSGGDSDPVQSAPKPKTPVRDIIAGGLDTIARFTVPGYGAVRGAMDISNFISRNRQPQVTNIVDEVALTGGRTAPTMPEGDSDTQIAQPIIPMMPLVPKLPTDIEPQKSDMAEFQQRFILPERFRLEDGGKVRRRKKGEAMDDDGEEPGPKSFPRLREGEIFLDKMPRPKKREILEAAEGGQVSVKDAEKMAPKGEFLAYINDDEAALLKSLGGAGQAVNETGIPSFFVKKLFKKATKAVKKVVKSPIGKAALLGAAAYYAPGFGIKAAGGFKPFLVGAPTTASRAAFSGILGTGGQFAPSVGKLATSIFGPQGLTKFSGTQKALAGIAGASILGGLAAGGEEEDIDSLAGRISDETGIDVAQIRKEVQDAYAKGDISGLQSKYPFLVPTSAAMADGGIARLGFDKGGSALEILAKEIAKDRGISYKEALKIAREEAMPGKASLFEKIGQAMDVFRPGAGLTGYANGGDIQKQAEEAMKEGFPRYTDEDGNEVSLEEFLKAAAEEDKKMVMPKRKPPKEVQKRKEKNFKKAKPALEKESADMVEDLIRSKKAGGGLMDLGGNEMDLRGGGFVPIGAKEKADDVPARLSKNEFVFTADAVRAAGGGSVEKGAQKMYNTMKQLEDSIA